LVSATSKLMPAAGRSRAADKCHGSRVNDDLICSQYDDFGDAVTVEVRDRDITTSIESVLLQISVWCATS